MSLTPTLAAIRQRFAGDSAPERENEIDLAQASDEQPHLQEPAVPETLAALFARREVARQASFPASLVPGLVIRISPDGLDETPGTPREPLAVLLDREVSPRRWRGWLVGRDPAYASAWDLILGPEEDPCDPQCQVVQVWNVTTLAVDRADRPLAMLPDARLGAVRALEQDLAANALPRMPSDTRPGVRLARELADGTGVVTGTPPGQSDDPRLAYQAIYRQAARWIETQPSPVPRSGASPSSSHGLQWLQWLFVGHWKPVAAFALAAVAVSAVLWQQLGDSQSVPDGNHYISGEAIQQLAVSQPAETARALESRLRALGIAPEIRHEAGDSVTLQADLARLGEDEQSRLLVEFGLKRPANGRLSVLIVRTP